MINLFPGAKPAFLSPNRFTRHADRGSDLTCTTGSTLRHRLYDNERLAQYTSAGAASDATAEVINAGLWLPGARYSFELNFWAVLNHNLGSLKVETSNDNGANWTTRYDGAGITTAYSRGVFANASADRVRVTGTATQTANQEKLLGAVYFAKSRFQATRLPLMLRPLAPRVGHKTAEMADKSIRSAPIFRSDASFKFQDWEAAFLVDDDTELANFRAVLDDYEPFLFMPRPGDWHQDIYLARIRPGTYSEAPMLRSHFDVRRVEMVIEELGAS